MGVVPLSLCIHVCEAKRASKSVKIASCIHYCESKTQNVHTALLKLYFKGLDSCEKDGIANQENNIGVTYSHVKLAVLFSFKTPPHLSRYSTPFYCSLLQMQSDLIIGVGEKERHSVISQNDSMH